MYLPVTEKIKQDINDLEKENETNERFKYDVYNELIDKLKEAVD